jgi:WD40 repeat protein
MSTTLPPLSPSEPPRVLGAPTLHTESELLALGQAVDGTLWSVEDPGLLRQWQLASRRELAQHPLDELATVWAFNWAGRLVASGSDEVGIWEVYSGEQLAAWDSPNGQWVTALAFQPGVAVLAVGYDDGLVQVWQWNERKLLHEWSGHNGGVSALAFSREQKYLAVAGEDRVIRLYDLEQSKCVRKIEGHPDRIPALAWHPDGNRLFSAGWDTTVRVWDANTGEPIILLNNHRGQVHAIALSADGNLIAAADAACSVHVWDTVHYREVAILRESAGEVTCLCFPPEDDQGNRKPAVLAYGGADRVIYLWDSRQSSEVGRDTDALMHRTVLALNEAGTRLYSLAPGLCLRELDVDSGDTVSSFDAYPQLHTFALSPKGQLALACSEERTGERRSLRLVDAQGRETAVCEGQKGPVTALAFAPSGQWLASGGIESSDVWVWQLPGGATEVILPDAVAFCSVEALAWHPDSTRLAITGIDHLATSKRDGEWAIWDVTARQCLKRFPGGATSIAFSPDGRWLAVANLRHEVSIYEVSSWEMKRELKGHRDTVGSLQFTPDSERLLSASEDRTLRLWDVITGDQLGAWELDNRLYALAMAPDGRFVYTGNGNTSCYQIELENLTAPVAP